MNEDEIVAYIKSTTRPIDNLIDSYFERFEWLSNEIYSGKTPLRANSVQFIVAKLHTVRGKPINLKKKGYFDLYVVGDFKKSFTPVLKVAEALAAFYSEFAILPNIIPLPKYILKQDKRLLYRLNNGVMLYERG